MGAHSSSFSRSRIDFLTATIVLILSGSPILTSCQQTVEIGSSSFAASQAVAQAVPPTASRLNGPVTQFNCPGSFPSDLSLLNCRYTQRARFDQFITTGLTDEAMAQSVFGSIFTQYVTHSPGEWPKDWAHYGYRVGTSYIGSVGRASAEYMVGSLIRDDPRHIKCSDDPRLFGVVASDPNKAFVCSGWQRFFHAIVDSITVRPSSLGEPVDLTEAGLNFRDESAFRHAYRRLPALDRLVGVYAASYAAYPWEPQSANTFGAISQRAALSFGTTFAGSFYTEFSGSLFSKLKKKH